MRSVKELVVNNNALYGEMKIFTENVCKYLDINEKDLEHLINSTECFRFTVYLPKLRVYLVASWQKVGGRYCTFFHITKKDSDINCLCSFDAYEVYKSELTKRIMGTESYSFTRNYELINDIYRNLEEKHYRVIDVKKNEEMRDVRFFLIFITILISLLFWLFLLNNRPS